MIPNSPRYVSPKERAENRARWLRFGYWAAVAIPAVVAAMMLGYSDQAPGWLRNATIALDRAFGFPALALIQRVAG